MHASILQLPLELSHSCGIALSLQSMTAHSSYAHEQRTGVIDFEESFSIYIITNNSQCVFRYSNLEIKYRIT